MDPGVKRNTKRVGDLSELRLMHDLVRAGYLVSIPFGENHRYDLVIEEDGVFHTHRGGAACRKYTNEIDYFGVYCPDLDSSYLIPIAELPVQQGMLRVRPTLNGQHTKLRWADKYLLYRGMAVGKELTDAVAPMALEMPL